MKRSSLLVAVRSRANLRAAWMVVHENGRDSKNSDIKGEIEEFSKNSEENLELIYRRLQKGLFHFEKAKGVLVKKKGKSKKRPIVIAPLQNRIVQRSILDVLQKKIPKVREVLATPTSFGGVKNQGVPTAIREVRRAMSSGIGQYYVRSDIEGFFKKIPRKDVVDKLGSWIPEKEFVEILDRAVTTELENMDQLRQDLADFPLSEIGVAQGNCLSPLIGNIFLQEFDAMMNGDGLVALRYIDDIIILAPNENDAKKGFEKAEKWLKFRGLKLFNPFKGEEKSEKGSTKERFEFLGCEFVSGKIRPSLASKKNVLKKLETEFDSALYQIKSGTVSYAKSLVKISGIIYGWSCHYWFCDDMQFFFDFDREVDALWTRFQSNYLRTMSALRIELEGKEKNVEVEIRRREGLDSVARVVAYQRSKVK